MRRTLTVASQKGGVGKTTTVLNLGYSLSQLGHSVLLIDADPQGGMAIASNLKRRTSIGLVQLLLGTHRLDEVRFRSKNSALAAIASGVVGPTEALALESAARDGGLAQLLPIISDGFDYVLIDAPAGVYSVVRALLTASDGVIIPMRCQGLQVKSLPLFLKLVDEVRRRDNPHLSLEGALITMHDDRSALSQEILAELYEALPEPLFFKTIIRYDEAYERASVRAIPLAMLADAPLAGRAYLDLAIELREREALRGLNRGEDDESTQGLF
jgi:chromosome partitioning protein